MTRTHPLTPGSGNCTRRAPLSPRTWLALAGWLLLSFAAAGVGGIASAQAPQFYAELVQPPWAPPPGVFGPVWSVLY
ncbi:TspO/MBR family protein, partial [Xanthomonas citri pv. citri]